MHLIPVVLGRVNYTKLLPPDSFIDVRDYESPEHLAKYLIHLSNNHAEYLRYFAWRQKYRLLDRGYTREKAFCHLCEMLHNPQQTYKRHFDIRNYWNHKRDCDSGNAELRAVHLQ